MPRLGWVLGDLDRIQRYLLARQLEGYGLRNRFHSTNLPDRHYEERTVWGEPGRWPSVFVLPGISSHNKESHSWKFCWVVTAVLQPVFEPLVLNPVNLATRVLTEVDFPDLLGPRHVIPGSNK